jgi:hypothetical protein
MSMFKAKSVFSKVGDQDVEFFSLSFPTLFAMKSAVGPIAKVLSNLFRGARQDVGRFQEDSKDPKTGGPVRVVQEQPISVEMAKLRYEQSQKTMTEAVEAIFADQNRLLIGRILMDSLRSSQPRRPSVEQIENFLADLDLGMVVELIQGVVKANAEVFGPLGSGWAAKAEALLRAQASSASPTSSAAPATNSESSAQAAPPVPRLVPKE